MKLTSKLPLAGALLILAGFLAFWIYQEYQRELINLATAQSLEEARQVILDQGHDMDKMMNDLKELHNNGEVEIQIGVHMDDHVSDSIVTSEQRHFRKSNMLIRNISHGSETILFENDSIVKGELFMDPQFNGEFNITQILHADSSNPSPKIKKEALFIIWPQFVFALILYVMILGSVALMRRSYQMNQSLMNQKNRLVSNLTHELKTPVSTINVALEALKDFDQRKDKEKSEAYMNIARKEIDRLSESIDLMMQLNVLDNQAMLYQKQEYSLKQLCLEIKDIMIPQLEQSNMNLEVRGSLGIVLIDVDHVRNAILNIIDNANKYGKEGGEILVSIKESEDHVELKIADDGIGISKENQNRVFDRFYRVQDDDRHDVKGHGLGLSYAKETIEALDGTIQLQSEFGKGTTFTIVFPAL